MFPKLLSHSCTIFVTDDPNRLHVPPTAAFIVLVTGALLVVIVILALLVKCATKLKKKAPPTVIAEQGLAGSPDIHRRVNRVRLDTHSWNHTSAVRYSSLSNPAPPSYTDTIQADQEAQHQISQQTPVSLDNMEQTDEQSSVDSAINTE